MHPDIVDRTIAAMNGPDGTFKRPPNIFIIAKFAPDEEEYKEILSILRNNMADGLGPTMALQFCTYSLGQWSNEELETHFSCGAAQCIGDIVPHDYCCVMIHPFTLAYPQRQSDWTKRPMYFLQRRTNNKTN